MRKVYIAGPDVFAPDWELRAARYVDICSRHGLRAQIPDAAPPADLTGWQRAKWIKNANVAMIRTSDAVIANVTPFRGPNADDGTAFEIGYAEALGKPVWTWSERSGESMIERIPVHLNELDIFVDGQGWIVEDFGLATNLMIAVHGCQSLPVPCNRFEQAVLLASRYLRGEEAPIAFSDRA